MSMDTLSWLQTWFQSRCDGDWEHGQGVRIRSLDNPGWAVTLDVTGTALEGAELARQREERSELDWIHVWLEGDRLEARGGPGNLGEMMERLRAILGG